MEKKIADEFSRTLKYPGCFGATADLWKDSYKAHTYISLVAHICAVESDKIIRKCIVFHADSLEEIVKSNEAIYNCVVSVFEKYNVPESVLNKKVKWVTDRGDNVKIALSRNDSTRFNCLAHIGNNIVGYMCENASKAKRIISNAT